MLTDNKKQVLKMQLGMQLASVYAFERVLTVRRIRAAFRQQAWMVFDFCGIQSGRSPVLLIET